MLYVADSISVLKLFVYWCSKRHNCFTFTCKFTKFAEWTEDADHAHCLCDNHSWLRVTCFTYAFDSYRCWLFLTQNALYRVGQKTGPFVEIGERYISVKIFLWNFQGLTRYLGSKTFGPLAAKPEPEMAGRNRMLVEGVESTALESMASVGFLQLEILHTEFSMIFDRGNHCT